MQYIYVIPLSRSKRINRVDLCLRFEVEPDLGSVCVFSSKPGNKLNDTSCF